MAISRLDMERQLRKDGGVLTLEDAKRMAPPGESLAYINPEEAALLKSLGGAGEDINGTGIKSYFFKKIFKKAKRAVKKVVKSPIGKAAILAAPFLMSGGTGGISKFFGKGSFNPFMAKGKFSGLGSLLNKVGLVSGTGGLTGLGKIAGIGALSGLGGLMAARGQEEENEQDIFDRGEGLDIDRIVRLARMNDPQFRFLPSAEFTGAYAEGGEVDETTAMIMDLLKRGMDNDSISTITGVSPEQILKLLNSVKKDKREEKAEGGIMNPMTMIGLSLLDKGSEASMKEQKKLMELLQKLRMTDPDKELRKRGELEELRRIEAEKRAEKRIDKAEGGIMNLGGMEMDLRGGGFVPIGAKEKADDVPARLSKNEFVMTADAVRAAGGGSVDKGADKMYKLMKGLEAQV
jgi:hypothetical protein